MKVIILAGGRGSRLSEITNKIPKPMVKICKVPILVRIIKHYNKYGFKNFLIASCSISLFVFHPFLAKT